MERNFRDPNTRLRAVAKPISFVPETMNCLTLLRRLPKDRNRISMVVDEYDGIVGLVTLEDLIETLLGAEIVDDTNRELDLQAAARRIRPQPWSH